MSEPTHTLIVSVPLNLNANPAAETWDIQDALTEATKAILPLIGLGTLGLLCEEPIVTLVARTDDRPLPPPTREELFGDG